LDSDYVIQTVLVMQKIEKEMSLIKSNSTITTKYIKYNNFNEIILTS